MKCPPTEVEQLHRGSVACGSRSLRPGVDAVASRKATENVLFDASSCKASVTETHGSCSRLSDWTKQQGVIVALSNQITLVLLPVHRLEYAEIEQTIRKIE